MSSTISFCNGVSLAISKGSPSARRRVGPNALATFCEYILLTDAFSITLEMGEGERWREEERRERGRGEGERKGKREMTKGEGSEEGLLLYTICINSSKVEVNNKTG